MIDKIKKIKENKALKIIGNILYILLFIVVVLMLIVVIMQRATNNNIAIGGIRMFSVATGSMEPVYKVGDVLISKEVEPQEISVGDDIVYKGEKGSFKDKVVTHRVISIDKQENGDYKIITKGVANTEEDPEINQNQVYGKIVYKMQILSFLGRIVKNLYVFYFIIFIPIGIISYKIIRNFFDTEEDDDDESEK